MKRPRMRLKDLEIGNWSKNDGGRAITVDFYDESDERRKIGTLTVSRAGIGWTRASKKLGVNLGIDEFDRWIEQYVANKSQ